MPMMHPAATPDLGLADTSLSLSRLCDAQRHPTNPSLGVRVGVCIHLRFSVSLRFFLIVYGLGGCDLRWFVFVFYIFHIMVLKLT